MKNEFLISVIVPVYNIEKEYLERCVRSIMNQTYRKLEILLVDDGSTDGSGTVCDSLAKEDERIRVFHKENGGSSSARIVLIVRELPINRCLRTESFRWESSTKIFIC